MNEQIKTLIDSAKKIVIIQAENPDGDSLGSALAWEQILGELGKDVTLHCIVQIPTYLRHISGWDRVSQDFDLDADLAIIVDTVSSTLLKRTLEINGVLDFLSKKPVVVFDHHNLPAPDFTFDAEYLINDSAAATGEMVYAFAREFGWNINSLAATSLFIAIQADTLGLTTESTTAESYKISAELVELGAKPADIENKRREMMKKSPRILEYKGRLIERIEYFCDGRLALVRIPFEEITEFSAEYNPTMLVLDEMRLVTGVDVACGVKTYPDGKFTAKFRTNLPVADVIAGYFGGGGHAYASGFNVFDDDFEKVENEMIGAVDKVLIEYDKENNA
jgi:phosphoesterase RecJ-like protein